MVQGHSLLIGNAVPGNVKEDSPMIAARDLAETAGTREDIILLGRDHILLGRDPAVTTTDQTKMRDRGQRATAAVCYCAMVSETGRPTGQTDDEPLDSVTAAAMAEEVDPAKTKMLCDRPELPEEGEAKEMRGYHNDDRDQLAEHQEETRHDAMLGRDHHSRRCRRRHGGPAGVVAAAGGAMADRPADQDGSYCPAEEMLAECHTESCGCRMLFASYRVTAEDELAMRDCHKMCDRGRRTVPSATRRRAATSASCWWTSPATASRRSSACAAATVTRWWTASPPPTPPAAMPEGETTSSATSASPMSWWTSRRRRCSLPTTASPVS